MKVTLRETFNFLSLPLMAASELAQEFPSFKNLVNGPIEKISHILGAPYDPNLLTNHIGTAAGAYLFAQLSKYQLGFQDKLISRTPFWENIRFNARALPAAFMSAACVGVMETSQMLGSQGVFDWGDIKSCMVSVGLFVLVNTPTQAAQAPELVRP